MDRVRWQGLDREFCRRPREDRTFMMEMMPQKHEERREQFRVRQVKPTADELKREIETWVRENSNNVRSCYDRSQFPYLDTFRDRTIDVSQPLAAILEIAYDGSSELQHSRRELIKAIR